MGRFTAQDATIEARSFAKLALERISVDEREYHPGFQSHLVAAITQLDAAFHLATVHV